MTDKTKPCILLIDDDEAMRDFMRMCLRGLNCTILEATSAAEAMVMMNAIAIDAVITDFNMPITNGLELSKMIRVVNAEVPIVLCSSDLLLSEQHILEAGVTRHIPKDIEHANVLRNFVRDRIEKKRDMANASCLC